jgi:GWxTD domain-containing protein
MNRCNASIAAALAGGVVASLAASGRVVAAERPIELPPLISRGDLTFQLDFAGFRHESGQTDHELYLAISNDQVVFRPGPDGALGGELQLRVRLTSTLKGKGKVFEATEKIVPAVARDLDATDRSIHQVIRKAALVDPGPYILSVELVDLFSEKPGIIHMIRKTKKKGVVEAKIEVPDFTRAELQISDPVFSRGVQVAEDDAVLARNGMAYDPNPSRKFGLVIPYLSYYAEVYAGNQFVEGDTVLIRTQVLDTGELPRIEKNLFVRPRSDAFVVHDILDLHRSIPAGSYALQIEAKNQRSGEVARISRPFEVIWTIESWGRDPVKLLEEMKLVMRSPDYETLEQLSPGAREVFLTEYWHDLDPNPETLENEALIEFRRRIQVADREFAQTLSRGMLSDRGRVYVRYGAPDDVNYQYSTSAFGVDENVERVVDPAERVEMSNRPGSSFLDPDQFREGDVSDLATQRGGTNIRSKQIEVWSYDGPGRPLVGRSSSESSNRGLKFIFADEMGNGEYELIGSEGTTDF